MELDHLFILWRPGDGLRETLEGLGLAETYRRRHLGQGTSNICYCFDNAFLELLWVEDAAVLSGPLIARTGLLERSRHRELQTCPLGLAWRGAAPGPVWSFRPPYLAPDMDIAVSVDSDDPRLPMMFQSPGDTPPLAWPETRRGALQHGSGFGSLRIVELRLPALSPDSDALDTIAASLDFHVLRQDAHMDIHLELARRDGRPPLLLSITPDAVRVISS
jgi:Glyoxalase-like domain